jgi:hypothetical protein
MQTAHEGDVMRKTALAMLGVALLALAPRLAGAQMAACAGDAERLCHGMRPGGGRIIGCLRGNAASLTPGCRAALGISETAPAAGERSAKGGGGAREACRPDVMRLCRSAMPDRAKIKSCLQAHAADLSDACKTAIIAHGK